LESMRCGNVCCEIDSKESPKVADQLIHAVLSVDSKQGCLKINNKTLPTESHIKLDWNEAGVFKKSGIRTVANVYYAGGSTRPEKYGYRLGDDAEALSGGLYREATRQNMMLDLPEPTKKSHPLLSPTNSYSKFAYESDANDDLPDSASLSRANSDMVVVERRRVETYEARIVSLEVQVSQLSTLQSEVASLRSIVEALTKQRREEDLSRPAASVTGGVSAHSTRTDGKVRPIFARGLPPVRARVFPRKGSVPDTPAEKAAAAAAVSSLKPIF